MSDEVSLPPQESKGLRLYARPYTEKLIEALAQECGFPVAFQSDQWTKLLDLLFSKKLVICKIYDDESWTQINQAWKEKRHFHMVPRWTKPITHADSLTPPLPPIPPVTPIPPPPDSPPQMWPKDPEGNLSPDGHPGVPA